MPERFEGVYIVYKRRYINIFPFLSGANAPAKLGVTRPKFTKFLSDVQGSSTMLTHSHIHVAILSSVVECIAQNEGLYVDVGRVAPKPVTIATSLEQSRK